MNYQGDIALGDTIDFKFTTVNTSGVPTTLAGTPVVSAYVDNGTTAVTAGVTLTVDFAAIPGMHNVRVVASSGNGFTTSTNVNLVITTGTVGGSSVVGYVIGSFSIGKRPTVLTTASVDAVWAKAMTEPASVPSVTASTLSALQWIFILARNKITQTSTTQTVRNDADSATIGTSTVSDDGTTFTRGKLT